MPHLIILDDSKELSQCLWQSAQLATEAHEDAEADPESPLGVAYMNLGEAIASAKSAICIAAGELEEKLN